MKNKIIVDTSIWIDFFRGKTSVDINYLEDLIKDDLVGTFPAIRYELLIGLKSKKELSFIQPLIESLEYFHYDPYGESNFLDFSKDLKSCGLLSSLVDMMIAYRCHKFHLTLWSNNHYFKKLAQEKIIKIFRK